MSYTEEDRRSLVQMIHNTMDRCSDGTTFDVLAETVADELIRFSVFAPDKPAKLWAHYYFMLRENRRLKQTNYKLKQKYREMRDKA